MKKMTKAHVDCVKEKLGAAKDILGRYSEAATTVEMQFGPNRNIFTLVSEALRAADHLEALPDLADVAKEIKAKLDKLGLSCEDRTVVRRLVEQAYDG
jgi:hypothetical protein